MVSYGIGAAMCIITDKIGDIPSRENCKAICHVKIWEGWLGASKIG